jgi:hypothetical protein
MATEHTPRERLNRIVLDCLASAEGMQVRREHDGRPTMRAENLARLTVSEILSATSEYAVGSPDRGGTHE